MGKLAIHWIAGLRWTDKKGWKNQALSGWACCCSGDRAYSIKDKGNGTTDRAKVTCKACIRNLRAANQ